MAAGPVSLSVRLQNALSQQLVQMRCEEVGRILNEATNKDATYILKAVTESIFGINGQVGWGLRTISFSGCPREFDLLRGFLGPTGPIMSLTYRLSNDPYILFEFPVAWLPAKSRSEMEEGSPRMFYINKIQNPGPGKAPTNILLNAFEFFIFHFAYFLVNGSSQRWYMSWTSAGDALYPTLLEDYMATFLPCDSTLPPGPPSPPCPPRGILSPVSPRSGSSNLHLTSIVSPIVRGPPMGVGLRSPGGGLLSPPGYTEGGSGAHASSPIVTPSSPLHPSHHQHTQLNTWTSQVVVQVMIEMWVNQSIPASQSTAKTASPSNQYTDVHACSVFSEHTPVGYRPNWHTHGFELFVPSSDHVRVVRMLTKHLHYFSNSIKSNQASPLDDLRKNIWSMYRKSLYQFLLHTFSHWPLDSSFRLLLETWLSYIQPWRYVDFVQAKNNSGRSPGPGGDGDPHRMCEAKWQGFIAENLLFYSLLFRHLISRLFRLDLSAPKNAQILFRLTKVFSQSNMSSYIREIEEALEDPHLAQRSLLGGPPHTPSFHTGGHGVSYHPDHRSLATVARSHIVEVDGPSHQYSPMFSIHNIQMVEELLLNVSRAHRAVLQEQALHSPASPNTVDGGTQVKAGWLTTILKGLMEPASPVEDDTAQEDIRKTITHLENAQRQLSSIFNLVLPLNFGQCNTNYNDNSMSSPTKGNTDDHSPDQVNVGHAKVLTDYGRVQLIRGMRRMDLKYEGNPDLMPICTFEIPFLVRWFYSLSQFLNKKYGTQLERLYYRENFISRLVRLILSPPETVYEYQKNSLGSPHRRVAVDLPARISLRFLASKHTLGMVMALCLVGHMLGLFRLLGNLLIPLVVMFVISYAVYQRYHSYTAARHQGTEEQIQQQPQQEQQQEDEQDKPAPGTPLRGY